MNGGPRRAVAVPVAAGTVTALAAGACVAIETAPGGLQSVRFEATPPSVVVGDTLRDSAGAVTVLRALAFDENDRLVATAPVRFAYVPTPDSTGAVRNDSVLVVDSLTGALRATRPLVRPQGRIAARVGDRFQLIDTLEIVIAPDSLVSATDTTRVLRYDCTDTRAAIFPVPDTGSARFAYSAVTLPAVTARGSDATGQRVGVPSRLMRYDVDSTPFWPGAIPRVPLTPGARDSVPVIAIVGGTTDRLRALDTTAAATGASTVRLRIRPSALGRDVVPARDFTVRVRVRGQPGPRALANDPLFVRVRLSRNPTPLANRPATCQ